MNDLEIALRGYEIATGVLQSVQTYGEILNDDGEHVAYCGELDWFSTDLHYGAVCLEEFVSGWVADNFELLEFKSGDELRDIGYTLHTASYFGTEIEGVPGLGLPASVVDSFPHLEVRPYTNIQFGWAGVRGSLKFAVEFAD